MGWHSSGKREGAAAPRRGRGRRGVRNTSPRGRLSNFASLTRFAFTRVRPVSCSLQLLRTVYGHHVGLPDDRSGRRLRVKLSDRWYPLLLPATTSLSLLLQVLRRPVYEPLATLPRPPRTIVDGGANIGLTALYFADRFRESVVHAFEPSRENFRVLTLNTAALGQRVLLNRAGVADVDGYGRLHLGDQSELHSLHAGMLTGAATGSECVRLTRLDTYLREQSVDRVDVLKLDVEGAELDALRGLGERLRDVAVVVGELHLRAVDEDEFAAFLEGNGFGFTIRSRPEGHIAMFEAAHRA